MTEFSITCKSTYMADDGYLWTVSHIHLFNREIFFVSKNICDELLWYTMWQMG